MTSKPDNKQIDLSTEQPADPSRRKLFETAAALGVASVMPAVWSQDAEAAAAPAIVAGGALDARLKAHVKNIVVIYLENRSFNNLFGDFPGVRHPLSAVPTEVYQQKDRDGVTVLPTLPKIWGGLVQKGQTVAGKYYLIGEDKITGLANAPFPLKDAEGALLPQAVVTRDLWHVFYQNQMQINGGKNDGFVAWADSGALTMGYYADSAQNLNQWRIAQEYTLCDNFFMAAFGGSFLNHQFLACARAPVYPNAANSPAKGKIAVLEDGPTGWHLKPAADSPASALGGQPKFVNNGAISPDDYAVNTMAPPYQPSYIPPAQGGDPKLADPQNPNTLPPQTHDTIGDLLSHKGVSWTWYAGAWQAALDGKGGPDAPNFQYHHQPFNYFQRYAPGTAARAQHLRDAGLGDSPMSNHFLADIEAGKLPAVAFYKPQGNLNLHAGYSDVESGDRHVANVLGYLKNSPQWKHMVVVITYDENGGWWDHVAPPKGDRFGPGSRIPAIVVSPFARKGHVDHTFYDTTSILRLITRVFDLPKLEGIKLRDEAFAAQGKPGPGDLTNALSI
ncbi:MAG: acid phosphatase [Paludibacterium sp.]|uniref:acid phosphatase n=1 Tax=Paludibacterium sp. TaxID=1917523 RepID=UPI0025F4FC76|nr:acid phosphatase [Paludibacterium sp.]MBV8048715.1 acid phosphatase [Paludibacterium sp.]MBV8649008.1 acid phosphatase [Paludibacterium sp.]